MIKGSIVYYPYDNSYGIILEDNEEDNTFLRKLGIYRRKHIVVDFEFDDIEFVGKLAEAVIPKYNKYT